MTENSYTLAQASLIAQLPLKSVQKLIDMGLIRPRRIRSGREIQRLLSPEQLLYLRLEADGVHLLPLAARREVAKTLASKPEVHSIVVTGSTALMVEVEHARQEVEQELKRLRKAQEMVVSNPEVMQGMPVFKGTRIPVGLVAEMASAGATVEEILVGYPALCREQLEAASLYVKAFPRRGRPVQRSLVKTMPIGIRRQRRTLT